MHAFDRQTDRQTDGQTEFSSLDRVCIPCSAVIKLRKQQFLIRTKITGVIGDQADNLLLYSYKTFYGHNIQNHDVHTATITRFTIIGSHRSE